MAVSTFHRITLAAQLFRSWRGWPPAKQVKVVESAYCIRLLFCSNRVIKRVLFCVVRGRETVFIPVLCIIFFGISMSLVVFFYLRYQAAVQLTKNHPKKETAQKLLSSRLAILPARRSRKSYLLKLASHKRRLSASNYELTTPNNIKEDAKVESVGNTEKPNPWWIREVKIKFNLLYFTLAHTSGKRDENKRFIYFGTRRVSQYT